jgi:hypothetical protein
VVYLAEPAQQARLVELAVQVELEHQGQTELMAVLAGRERKVFKAHLAFLELAEFSVEQAALACLGQTELTVAPASLELVVSPVFPGSLAEQVELVSLELAEFLEYLAVLGSLVCLVFLEVLAE